MTPDLLRRLRASFPEDEEGVELDLPWIAVADVLNGPFFRSVERGLYELDDRWRPLPLGAARSRQTLWASQAGIG